MVAAVSVATPAFCYLWQSACYLKGIGSTSLISRMLGEGKKNKAKRTSSFSFWTSLVVGIISMIVIWIFNTLYAERLEPVMIPLNMQRSI